MPLLRPSSGLGVNAFAEGSILGGDNVGESIEKNSGQTHDNHNAINAINATINRILLLGSGSGGGRGPRRFQRVSEARRGDTFVTSIGESSREDATMMKMAMEMAMEMKMAVKMVVGLVGGTIFGE